MTFITFLRILSRQMIRSCLEILYMTFETLCRCISVVPVDMAVLTVSLPVTAGKPEPYTGMFKLSRDPCLLPVAVIAELAELVQVWVLLLMTRYAFRVKPFKVLHSHVTLNTCKCFVGTF